jgi:hypothetical protein
MGILARLKPKMHNLGLVLSVVLATGVFATKASPSRAADPNSENVPSSAGQTFTSELADGWRLLRTHHPKGGGDAISITHPADTSRSDLDLVGLMIRCTEKTPEVLVVVLPTLRAGTRPHVTLESSGDTTEFVASIASPGTLVLLPDSATTLVSGQWQTMQDLFVRVDNDKSAIHGAIKLTGLPAAFKQLQSTCAAH